MFWIQWLQNGQTLQFVGQGMGMPMGKGRGRGARVLKGWGINRPQYRACFAEWHKLRKSAEREKTEGQRIHPSMIQWLCSCLLWPTYVISRAWLTLWSRVFFHLVSLETPAKVKSMLFPRPDTAFEASKLKRWLWFDTCRARGAEFVAGKRGLESGEHNALPHRHLPQLWSWQSRLRQKRLRCALCNEKIAVHSRRFLWSCNLYNSYQVLARERLSMLVSDFTWKVGGMSCQVMSFFLLISQSHAMDTVPTWMHT